MTMDELRIDPLWQPQTEREIAKQAVNKTPGGSFGNYLEASLNEINKLHQKADLAAKRLMTGEDKDIHNTMIAAQKADISFQLLMQIRNKIISAYDEIRRMQI
jgi:flagellar hook-basal body complex protein FliE